jgi:hypothetical protein
MKNDALHRLVVDHLNTQPVSRHAATRLQQARLAALARHARHLARRAPMQETLSRWWATHTSAARRGAWAMAVATVLSVSYVGWMAWAVPSEADVDIALLTSDLPVEAYLHPTFTTDL